MKARKSKLKSGLSVPGIIAEIVLMIMLVVVLVMIIQKIPSLSSNLPNFFQMLFSQWFPSGTPIDYAALCAYYRCAEGCENMNAEARNYKWLVNGVEVSCANFCNGYKYFDMNKDGRICDSESFAYPILVDLKNTLPMSSAFVERKGLCYLDGYTTDKGITIPKKFVGSAKTDNKCGDFSFENLIFLKTFDLKGPSTGFFFASEIGGEESISIKLDEMPLDIGYYKVFDNNGHSKFTYYRPSLPEQKIPVIPEGAPTKEKWVIGPRQESYYPALFLILNGEEYTSGIKEIVAFVFHSNIFQGITPEAEYYAGGDFNISIVKYLPSGDIKDSVEKNLGFHYFDNGRTYTICYSGICFENIWREDDKRGFSDFYDYWWYANNISNKNELCHSKGKEECDNEFWCMFRKDISKCQPIDYEIFSREFEIDNVEDGKKKEYEDEELGIKLSVERSGYIYLVDISCEKCGYSEIIELSPGSKRNKWILHNGRFRLVYGGIIESKLLLKIEKFEPKVECEKFTTKESCENVGCYWSDNNGSCSSHPL